LPPEGDPVLTTLTDGVADVRLNRPEALNAVDDTMFTAILETAVRLRSDPSVRAVVLSGAGRGFCAGLDTSVFARMDTGGEGASWRPPDADAAAAAIADVDGLVLGRSQRAVLVWTTIPVPVIAGVHGAAVGFGLQFALGADIRIVSPDAKLGALEINWGLAPDSGGTQLLPRLIGADHALELCATGRVVSGREAVELGLATRVAEDPHTAAIALARQFAGRNPEAVRSIARLVRLGARGPAQSGLLAEREEMVHNVGSDNQREAVAAMREGRSPVFTDAPRSRTRTRL
jgi:enoyl-CoA hydratase/carnithine racemase